MSEKQVVITEEQWEETVDNWINRAIDELTNYDCGFCTAIQGYSLTCVNCPAGDEVCDFDVVYWAVRGKSIEKALEVLEWLYDFGKIAEWC
jgi:hypothetical protein